MSDSSPQPQEPESDGAPSRISRDLLWGLAALLVFVIVSLAILVTHNPRARDVLSGPAHLTIKVVHTNDTWGYLDPCG